MLSKYRKEMALRKKLHNELVDLKGNIRVYCRIRPPIGEDGKGPDAALCITPDPKDDQLCVVDNKGKVSTFELDSVFGPESTQQGVFDNVKDLICSVVDGFNVCIFAYGQVRLPFFVLVAADAVATVARLIYAPSKNQKSL